MAVKKNIRDKDLLLTLGTIVITLAVAVSSWLFYVSQEASIINGLMNSVAKSNEQLVQMMADQIERNADSDQEATEILSSSDSDGISYWSLYSQESLIFEKNKETTGKLAGFSHEEVEDYYIRQGGTGAGELFRLMDQGQSFSIVMSKDKRVGNELISTCFLRIGDKSYCLSSSILQSYLLSSGRIGETIQYLRILVAGILLVFGATVIYFSVLKRRDSIRIQTLTEELQAKNFLVQEQGDRLFVDENDDLTTDIRTGLYTKAFFDVVMEQLAEREDVRVGFLYFRLDNISEMYGISGYQGVSTLLNRAAQVLLTNATEKDISARAGNSEFVMICFEKTPDSVHRLCRKIAVSLAELDAKASFSSAESFMADGEKPIQAFEKARKAAVSR